MSFSDIFSWIGTAAGDVGASLKNIISPEAMKLKNPATGAMERAPQQGFWGAFSGEGGEPSPLAKLIQRNVRFGGSPAPAIQGRGSILKKSQLGLGYKGGPSLPAASQQLDQKDIDLIRQIGKDWAKARAQRASERQWREGQPPAWSAAMEDYYQQPSYEAPPEDAISWEDYLSLYYPEEY